MTVEAGKRIRNAVVEATKGAGITRAIISGIANEYIQYLTTPEEYQRQHYEGGSTLFGKNESLLLQAADVDLAKALADGKPAPTPFAFDPTNGVKPTGPAFPDGAERGRAQAQPQAVERLERAEFKWSGGVRGYDRPVDSKFVTIQKRGRDKRWHHVTDDLGLQIIWSVDGTGLYTAKWEVPLSAQPGNYRFVVSAKKYQLSSKAFAVAPSQALEAKQADGVVRLAYPKPVVNVDITYRPEFASGGGTARFLVDGKPRVVKATKGGGFRFPAGTKVELPAGAARDRYGNTNGNAQTLN
jgi:neutral ceramidase